ncbi:DUF4913 domain-containing protein [Rhodococcoides fascians]|uniref:DUF4913 domain-containing protein n=1 Tax=Rhodococcoides fascians TaxID=1828 RepID=UPI000AB4511D|nr:DUF4913 domain-containing protein [Rhodococcus fascians]
MSEPPVEDYFSAEPPHGDEPGDSGYGSEPDYVDHGEKPAAFPAASIDELMELVGSLRQRLHREAELIAESTLSEHLSPELYHALRVNTTPGVLDAIGASAAETPPPAAEKKSKPAETYFRTLDEFVDEWLFTVYRREVTDTNDRRWCSQWRRHSEAVARIDAMWHVFEVLRTDPGLGASVLWKDHLDVHMEHLMSPTGPFEHCSVREGHTDRMHRLPSESADTSAAIPAAVATGSVKGRTS